MTDAIIDPPEHPTLTDGRVLLRPLGQPDRDALYAAVVESKEDVGRWMDWCKPDYSLDDAEIWLEGCEKQWAREDGERTFGIFDAASLRYVGNIGLNQFNRMHRFVNLGYWVRSGRVRQGFASASVVLLARHAFETLGVTRIEIVAQVGNIASRRVAEKAGCTLEAIARNRLTFHGEPRDAALYSLIPGDLRGAR